MAADYFYIYLDPRPSDRRAYYGRSVRPWEEFDERWRLRTGSRRLREWFDELRSRKLEPQVHVLEIREEGYAAGESEKMEHHWGKTLEVSGWEILNVMRQVPSPSRQTVTEAAHPPVLPFITPTDAGRDISGLRKELASGAARKTWAQLAGLYGVNKGMLWRIVHKSYEPRRPDIRRALGLAQTEDVVPGKGVTMLHRPVVLRSSRPCACGCGSWLVPGSWNQAYLPGHRKHSRRLP